MKQKLRLTVCLLIAFLFSLQGVTHAQVVLTDSVARLVLKDLAELDYRRDVGRIDSLTIVDLLRAYQASDSALIYCQKSNGFLRTLSINQEAITEQFRKELTKERRKGKRITVVAGVAVVIALIF